MEGGSNSAVMRIGIVLTVVFLVSCIKSCEEIKYTWGAKEAKAKVLKITEERGRYGRHTGYRVTFEFYNSNVDKRVRGHTIVATAEAGKYAVGQQLDVEYTGGGMSSSRLAGTSNRAWVYVFLGSLVAIVGTIVAIAVMGKAHAKQPRKRRQR